VRERESPAAGPLSRDFGWLGDSCGGGGDTLRVVAWGRMADTDDNGPVLGPMCRGQDSSSSTIPR